jgi:hypothetical protein
MSRLFVLLALLSAALVATASAAPFASERPGQSVRPADGSYQVADWNDRVCCKRGWQDWWTTRRACRNAGGYQTRNKDCREDWNDKWDLRWWGWTGGDWNRRVCCKRGNRDWFTTARECRNAFGYETDRRECRDDVGDGNWGERVCCKRGWQDWWTTRRACQNAGGYQTANRECREDWNDKWDLRWWNWNGGDWNRRVCCKRGNQDWWTTARECRNSFGYETDRRQCRNDGDNWPGNNGGPGNWQPNYNDSWSDPQGNPDRRVCCKWPNGQDDWRSSRDCHYSGGSQVMNRECRNE